jgi:hypothetical protein
MNGVGVRRPSVAGVVSLPTTSRLGDDSSAGPTRLVLRRRARLSTIARPVASRGSGRTPVSGLTAAMIAGAVAR